MAAGARVPAASCSARSGSSRRSMRPATPGRISPGEAEPALAVGSHVDSVPDGGWLDGALGVMGGLGVLRAWAGTERKPPLTLALVDWADEEGARFGRSLFGSSAAAGTLDPAELANARDADGLRAPGVLAENGVDLERVLECGSRLERLGAYLELHIEQGPGARGGGDQGRRGDRLRRGRASSLRDPGPGRPRRHDSDGRPPRRRARRGGGGAADRGDRARRGRCGDGRRASTTSRGSSRRSPGSPRCRWTSATGTRTPWRGCSPSTRDAVAASATERGCETSRGADLEDRADRLRPGAGRVGAGRLRTGHRNRLRAAQRRAPRCRLDGADACPPR